MTHTQLVAECEAETMQVRFAQWVALLQPCIYWSETHANELAVLAYYNVPEFWHEPVRVMAHAASYCGADMWMYENNVWTDDTHPFG